MSVREGSPDSGPRDVQALVQVPEESSQPEAGVLSVQRVTSDQREGTQVTRAEL